MLMDSLLEFGVNYLETSGTLWQYYRDKTAVNESNNIIDFKEANVTDLLNFKVKITGRTDDDGAKNIETMES